MNKLAISAIAVASAFVSPASASNTGSGYISSLTAMPNGVVMFLHSAGRSAVPSCVNSATSTRWAINASTDAGRVQLSVLLSAYGGNKKIHINGTGSCSAWGDTETVDFFIVDP